LDLVRVPLEEPFAFGRRVRFIGFGWSVDAESATAVSSTIGSGELAESRAGAGRGLAQMGVTSNGSNRT
jgi:hypothetical protein